MRILFLSPYETYLAGWLRDQGFIVEQTEQKISDVQGYDFIVSYGYRYILRKDVLDQFPKKAINLHISYLPWNRGADPNFWSFVENTPKGVTIHYMDEGIDTGNIIAQRWIVPDMPKDTLSTFYHRLHDEIQELFVERWGDIVSGNCPDREQTLTGTTHKTKDKRGMEYLLKDGWDTPISVLDDYHKLRSTRHG